jgi:hypothetical protein
MSERSSQNSAPDTVAILYRRESAAAREHHVPTALKEGRICFPSQTLRTRMYRVKWVGFAHLTRHCCRIYQSPDSPDPSLVSKMASPHALTFPVDDLLQNGTLDIRSDDVVVWTSIMAARWPWSMRNGFEAGRRGGCGPG